MRLRLASAVLASGLAAWNMCAATTCFSAFGGSVQYQFVGKSTFFSTPGMHAIPGVVFGSLSSCAGLSFWGVVGTVVNDGKTTVLGLRDETADATNCGAVDVTVQLSQTTLSGPLQLYNERTNFGNTSTLAPAKCLPVPQHPVARRGRDVMGN